MAELSLEDEIQSVTNDMRKYASNPFLYGNEFEDRIRNLNLRMATIKSKLNDANKLLCVLCSMDNRVDLIDVAIYKLPCQE